ncbi:MATE family efflux transporter [Endozoicomonas sp. SCSIO W0465]|uniref:MATE family efflux transporter n=1 Tax=Endozoicomonas sp. SCSIO W0465 TaxID=2918516 RepID=UPI002075A233|nr:MATE family efflux transporter [Endozoicomonas sp. SCSIO W0465]USE39200.1 MATE family efflux transporter [Endozoicomonas sp. SCSIO W0465]
MKQRLATIFQLGFPIMLAMLSQSMINLVDTALVGPLGENALAAVGAGSYANFVALSLMTGLSAAIQAQVARRVGAGRLTECAMPTNHGLIIAFCFASPLSIILVMTAPWLLELFDQSSPSFTGEATDYFQIRVMALTAAAMNLSFRGFWNGIGQPNGFLKLLVCTHICNVIFSFILIYGKLGLPVMGVQGAALGTLLSMYLGALLNLCVLNKRARQFGFLTHWKNWASFKRLVYLAIPDSLQQTLFALGMMMLFAIVAQLGIREMAIAHVLLNISLFLILPGLGLGMAANTLVSQSLGAREPEVAWRWGQEVMYTASAVLLVLSLPLIFAPEAVLSLFLHDPSLLAMGLIPLQLTGIGVVLDAPSLVFVQTLLGAGANRTVLCIRFVAQWLILLPLCWLIGPALGLGLTALWTVPTLQRMVTSISFLAVWRSRRWSNIQV